MIKHLDRAAFVLSALRLLSGEAGDRPCSDRRGRPSTLRKEWSRRQLELWAKASGPDWSEWIGYIDG